MAWAAKELWSPTSGELDLQESKITEAQIIRVSILVGALLLGFTLWCGGALAASNPTQRSRLPSIDNPYCAISTYLLRDFAEQATSMLDRNGRPVIVVSASTLAATPSYAHFLMAHECCHHTLGHVRRFFGGLGQLGPQPFYYIRPALRNMELDADICAVRMLKATDEPEAIEAARQRMLSFGTRPTGAYYPTGIERAEMIAKRAAQE